MNHKLFKPTIEESHVTSHKFNEPAYIRGIFTLFAILYGLFGLIDLAYFPDIIYLLITIRFIVVIPLFLSVILLTYSKYYEKYHQLVISLSYFIGGIGVAYMLLLKKDNVVYYGGLYMIFFSGYLLIRLRFKYATISGISILLFYMIGHLIMHGDLTEHFLYSTLFFFGANIIGMVGCYNIERNNKVQHNYTVNLNQANEILQEQYNDQKIQFDKLEQSIKENEELKKINHEKETLSKSLKESEEQYRLLATQMHLGLALHEMIFDEQGKPIDYVFISVNDSFERITGLKRENLIGKRVLSVLPETESYWIETYGIVAMTGEPVQFENYSKALNRHYSLSAYSPKKGQFAVIIEDITDKKKQEVEQKEKTQALLQSQRIAKLGTWRLDAKTHEVTWSDELYKMFGLTPTPPPPPFSEHMHLFTPTSWEMLSEALYRIRKDGTSYNLELETVLVDGSHGWMWVTGNVDRNDENEIVALIGTAQDITERRRLEDALLESNEKFTAIFEKSPVAIEFYDTKGGHLYANEAAIALFGVIDPKELKGKNLFDNPNLDKSLMKRITQFEQVSVEIEYDFEKVKKHHIYKTHKSGTIVLQLSITPLLKNDQLSGYILHSEDITLERQEQKEIEYLSYHDYLTNLYNRRYFVNAYKNFLAQRSFPLGLIMIDINGLKIINDAYGHIQGDVAIKRVSQVLLDVFGQNDVVARIGGDEYAILVPHCNHEDMLAYKEKIIEITKHMSVGNIELSLAIGYDVVDNDKTDIDDLLSTAENFLYRHKTAVGSSVRNKAIKAILNTLSDKYEDEKIHSERVSYFCKKMGIELGLDSDEVNLLELAGMYHDIGKISIPDAILNKPGKLTNDEYEIIKTHTLVGYQILKAADEYSGLAEYALSHHERWDGRGYPKGLIGDEIPLFSRIISVADSFEAMTADRPYRKGMPIEDAIAELKRCMGTQFDPRIAELFINKKLYLE
ncbi:MAG: diguanylate cyclase [Acholeplasmataceae bacterium]|jgi:diguanylate cyclase (GGDEF)-like protein/PAS domain S-box-containing protein|nr:diguanylate cyclase [Acholeplasmataceae bacterium]